jgi:hypothetical protein
MAVIGQLHAPAALPLRKESPVSIEWKVGWDPEPVWTLWSREKYFASAGNQTLAVWSLACRCAE